MANEKWPVVILAGGPTPERILDAGEKEGERAFIDVNGKPMLQWVIDACNQCDLFDRFLCIGNAPRLVSEFGLPESDVKPQGNSMLDNFITGLEHFRDAPLVMQMTCDIPLLTPEALQHLVDEVNRIPAEVYYPIIDVKHFGTRFEGTKRTTVPLKEGTFTGGNIFIFKPKVVLAQKELIGKVIKSRKSPAKLVKLLGLAFIVKFMFKQLDLRGLEEKASQILNAKMRAILSPHPEVGFDVDKPEDLDLARAIFAGSV